MTDVPSQIGFKTFHPDNNKMYHFDNPHNPNVVLTFAAGVSPEKAKLILEQKSLTDYLLKLAQTFEGSITLNQVDALSFSGQGVHCARDVKDIVGDLVVTGDRVIGRGVIISNPAYIVLPVIEVTTQNGTETYFVMNEQPRLGAVDKNYLGLFGGALGEDKTGMKPSLQSLLGGVTKPLASLYASIGNSGCETVVIDQLPQAYNEEDFVDFQAQVKKINDDRPPCKMVILQAEDAYARLVDHGRDSGQAPDAIVLLALTSYRTQKLQEAYKGLAASITGAGDVPAPPQKLLPKWMLGGPSA